MARRFRALGHPLLARQGLRPFPVGHPGTCCGGNGAPVLDPRFFEVAMSPSPSDALTPEQEKNRAAMASMGTAVVLTSLKLGVGWYTNSLGMLSEALHSGLDLLAAGVTLVAVRMAAQPADAEHAYGHGKAENLAALVETGLLLATCVWIVHEAVERLFLDAVPVVPSLWGVAVMGLSIALDVNRVRLLRRVAKKHGSQALEADALHFSSDILSSAVVLVGLLLLWAAQFLPAASPWRAVLPRGDALAALAVAGIVLHACWGLARRAVDDLMDVGPAALRERVRQLALSVEGVNGVGAVRLRVSGPATFVDLCVGAPPRLTVEEGHQLANRVEEAICRAVPQADVTVHIEPCAEQGGADVRATVQDCAATHGITVHTIHTWQQYGLAGKEIFVELHAEFPADTSLSIAHERLNLFEADVRQRIPQARLVSHIEPASAGDHDHKVAVADARELQQCERDINYLLGAVPEASDCHNLRAHYDAGPGGEPVLALSFHCRVEGGSNVEQAHAISEDIERLVRQHYPHVGAVVIHMEPEKAERAGQA